MRKIWTTIAVIALAAIAYAATITFTDDDIVQYATVTPDPSKTIPAGAELHLYLKTSEQASFTDVGIVPVNTQIVLMSNTVRSGLSLDTLWVQFSDMDLTGDNYQIFTRYQMYISDLDSTVYGATGDTALVNLTVPVIPSGEGFTVTVDK